MDTFLRETYYNPAHVAGFGSVRKLLTAAKNAGFENATLGNVKRWLLKQETYGLTKPARRHFKRSSVVVEGLDAQWEVDLMDMSRLAKFNSDRRYVLVVVDVFSRFCWTNVLKTKTATEVARALSGIFQLGRKPRYSLRSDKGREFTGKAVQRVLEENGIHHYLTHNETKAGHVERLVKTLKTKLFKYMLHKQTHTWSKVVSDVTGAYNRSMHRSLGRTPASVNQANEAEVRLQQYLIKNKIKLPGEPRPKPRKRRHPKPATPKFKVDEVVRISKLPTTFAREYDEKWTSELFRVKRVYKRQGVFIYKLVDWQGEDISGSFYSEELTKGDEPEGGVYKIERVIKKRGRGKRTQGLIRWFGWPSKYDSWIPLDSIKALNRATS